MPRRALRVAVAAAGIAAATTVLSACQQPVPNVTLLAGSTTVVVRPQTYAFDTGQVRVGTSAVASISARAGSSIFVDVPRNVASHVWSVTSGTLSQGKFTPLQVDGVSSPNLQNTHSTRVVVPYASGAYYLVVNQQTGSAATGSWVTQVAVTN